jgi:hypothetical protein
MAGKTSVMKGKALWCKVFEPDTKFDTNGIYSVNVLIPEAEAVEVCEYLDGLVDARREEEIKAKPKLKNGLSTKTPYEPEYDQNGDPTGNIEFKLKLKAKVITRTGDTYEQKPIVVDAKRTPIDKDTAIGNGSVIKVAYEPIPYMMASTKQVGVSLRMKGVQVIDLVEYGGGSSMFDDEDGFVSAAVAKDDANDSPFDDEATEYGQAEGDF